MYQCLYLFHNPFHTNRHSQHIPHCTNQWRTINEQGDYGFLLTAVDGEIKGGGGLDKFRIKIWDRVLNSVVYDNDIGMDDSGSPTTSIGGGSIIIHTAK